MNYSKTIRNLTLKNIIFLTLSIVSFLISEEVKNINFIQKTDNVYELRFNQNLTDPSLNMFISETDADGTNIADFLQVIDDSTSTIKGHVKISQRSDASVFNIYSITSTNIVSKFSLRTTLKRL